VIYLLNNGAALDEAVKSDQSTPLLMAASFREIDILRMLLRRGASLDRLDENGCDACVRCISPPYVAGMRKVAVVDMLKVINEYASLETNAIDYLSGMTTLSWTASYHSAAEIDFLISHVFNVEDQDSDNWDALCYAAFAGNPATYFALLAHGSPTALLAENLLVVVTAKADLFNKVTDNGTLGPGLHDPILRDILNRRADLTTSICFVDGKISYLQGPAIPLQQVVAAYGPDTEAWFLGLLQECGLETGGDRRRLQELRTGESEQRGIVIGEVQEESDDDRLDEDIGERGQSATRIEEDDIEEDECFWDAEEGE
jgi:hypothetical protein